MFKQNIKLRLTASLLKPLRTIFSAVLKICVLTHMRWYSAVASYCDTVLSLPSSC